MIKAAISVKTIVCATFALIAFAGNSVLCRLALGNGSIDPASFTIIRLLSGSVVLALIIIFTTQAKHQEAKGSWLTAAMLFIYAVCFSYGYVSLDTGTGALILFGAVQLSMIVFSLYRGNKLHAVEWVGLAVAFGGLYLTR